MVVANLLGNDTHRIVLNTASINATLDADITVLTPGAAPRVLDNPVLGGALNTPTDDGDTVIRRLSSAARAVHDTTAVVIELGSIDSDGKRTILLDGSHHLLLVAGGEGVDALHLHLGLAGIELAAALSALVRIVGLEHETTVVLDPVHSVSGPATVTAVVVVITVDDLLLREGKKLVVLEEVGTLASNNSAESPAGTALTLILNLSDSTLLTPIEALRETVGNSDISTTDVSRDVKKDAVPLLIRELGPAVVGGIDGVQLSGASHVLLEDGIAGGLLTGVVDLTELLLVSNPEGISLISKRKSASCKSKNNKSPHVFFNKRQKFLFTN